MLDLSRRTLLGGGLAIAGACACPFSNAANAKHVVTARRFVDAIGICTHPNWRDTGWGTSDWASAFLRTGVMNTRGKVGRGPSGRAALADLRRLFATGVKVCATVPETRGAGFDLAATKASLEFLAEEVGAQNLCGIESANEYNGPRTRTPDWARELRRFQKWLHDTVRSNPIFTDVPLIGPSIWRRLPQDYLDLGNLEPNVDRGCLHYYTGGRRPTQTALPSRGIAGGRGIERTLRQTVAEARIQAPTKPLWVTEFGYPLRCRGAEGTGNITQAAAAKYLIRGLFDLFGAGVEKVFIYALLDNAQESPPRYHGLVNGALEPRLPFDALRNLIRLFADDGPPSPIIPLGFSIDDGVPDIRHWAFSKSDGTSLLAIYRDVDSFDLRTGSDITVRTIPVRLSLVKTARKVEVFSPTLSAAVREVRSRVSTVTLPVSDHVTVVKITP